MQLSMMGWSAGTCILSGSYVYYYYFSIHIVINPMYCKITCFFRRGGGGGGGGGICMDPIVQSSNTVELEERITNLLLK